MVTSKYVILGGGMVAGYAAKEFAERGAGGDLLIISSDDVPPYERPPLSKGFLAGADEESSVFINPRDWYDQQGIGLRLKTIVEHVDPGAKCLRIAGGEDVTFEKLLIATGAHVRTLDVPGGDLDGVCYLRSLDDSKRIRASYQGAKNAVVLGSGFIGMEVAAVLAQQGIATTMVFPEERVWQRIFTPEMSAFFETYYEGNAVTFRHGDTVERFEGDGRVRAAITKSGTRLDADVVVAGVGVVPAADRLRESGLAIDNGLVVNEYLETSAPGVYAAGDIANYRDVVFDTHRRVEHWDNAVEQGKHAAQVMLGDRKPFVHVPYFFSDVFDLSYELWGDPTVADASVVRGDVTTNSFSTWWLRGGVLVAAFVMNRPDEERDAAPQWIEEHRRVSADRLQDDARSLAEAAEPAAA
jgi:NADPH-dependent 2,4-dienoyl-CoA reductase/sulfur reductase-like enzyme